MQGYLGHAMVTGTLARTGAGFHGLLSPVGGDESFEVRGMRGPARHDDAMSDQARDADMAEEAPEYADYDCHFDVFAHGELFGRIDARCVEPASVGDAEVTVDGAWRIAASNAPAPAFLTWPTYANVPAPLLLALAREDDVPRACAPFVDVRLVRRLPPHRLVVVFQRSVPCEDHALSAGASSYELALVDERDLSNPKFTGPLRGIKSDTGEPTLVIHSGGADRLFFELTFTEVWTARHGGRDAVNQQRLLFGLDGHGRAGAAFSLPDDMNPLADCNFPVDTFTPAFVELDGKPPFELVVEDRHLENPCAGAAPEDKYTAYQFDMDSARFVPVPLASGALAARYRAAADTDLSRQDDDWLEVATSRDCTGGAVLLR